MSKRIESMEDLAKIAGAELGTKQGQSKIEKAAENTTEPSKAPKKPRKSPKPKKQSEIDAITASDYLAKRYNAYDVGHIKRNVGPAIILDDVRNAPNPINKRTRTLKKKDLPKLIKEEAGRAERLKKSYLNGIKRGENNVGYVLASISVERDVERMMAYLAELTEERA